MSACPRLICVYLPPSDLFLSASSMHSCRRHCMSAQVLLDWPQADPPAGASAQQPADAAVQVKRFLGIGSSTGNTTKTGIYAPYIAGACSWCP